MCPSIFQMKIFGCGCRKECIQMAWWQKKNWQDREQWQNLFLRKSENLYKEKIHTPHKNLAEHLIEVHSSVFCWCHQNRMTTGGQWTPKSKGSFFVTCQYSKTKVVSFFMQHTVPEWFVLSDFSQSGTQHRTIVHKLKCPCCALDARTCSQRGVSSGSRQRRQAQLTWTEELQLGFNNHESERRKHESWMTLIQEERANTTSSFTLHWSLVLIVPRQESPCSAGWRECLCLAGAWPKKLYWTKTNLDTEEFEETRKNHRQGVRTFAAYGKFK